MSRALLALALAFSLGNPAAVQSWTEALVQLALSAASSTPSQPDYGNQWDPNGAGAESDGSGAWDPNGAGAESDAGGKWDPNG
jgi:hypothetical protein